MNSIGQQLKMTVFGQSHSQAIGVVLDGLPAGEAIDLDRVQSFLDRRAPGRADYATARKEADAPQILSGLVEGRTCGAPLAMIIENHDARSKDYSELARKPRPMHADYPAWVKTGGARDVRGGGEYSGRLTAPLCFAGAVCLQLLERRGIAVGAHIAAIAGVEDAPLDPVAVTAEQLRQISAKEFPVLDDPRGAAMRREIQLARESGDSVGGVIECAAVGLAPGWGGPMFDGVENQLSRMIFGIPAVRGIEFGAGFAAAAMRGSAHNDPYRMREGRVVTESNRHGGVLGGMTTGMPLVFRAALKPTPSISLPQRTVDLATGEETELLIHGRHDPCVVPRAVPCIEAAAAVTVLDLLLSDAGWE